MVVVCNLSTKESEVRGFRASQPRLLGEFQASEGPCFKTQSQAKWYLKEADRECMSSWVHGCMGAMVHGWMHTHTRAYLPISSHMHNEIIVGQNTGAYYGEKVPITRPRMPNVRRMNYCAINMQKWEYARWKRLQVYGLNIHHVWEDAGFLLQAAV